MACHFKIIMPYHAGKAITSWAVSLSLGLPLPPDQSNACTEYAASAAWLRTVKTTSTSSSSQFLHPTGFAWGKIKTKRPGQEEGREAWGQAAYSVQAFDWSCGKGRPEEGDTADLIITLVTAFYRGVRFSSVLSFAPSATVLFTNCLTVSHRRPLQL